MFDHLFRGHLHEEKDVWRFVIAFTLMTTGVALTIDVANHLIFFNSWYAAVRSWCVTVIIATAVTVPAARAVGRAYLGLHLAKAEILRQSRTDDLTGIGNRRSYGEQAHALDPPYTISVMDIDRFKSVNDLYGHAIGDAVIVGVVRRLADAIGEEGWLFRMGGEEFAILVPTAATRAVAERLDRIRESFAHNPIHTSAGAIPVTICFGVASWADGRTLDDVYIAADKALYFAKNDGRNRVCVEGPSGLETVTAIVNPDVDWAPPLPAAAAA